MRKSFTRLFGLFILFCMITLQVVASAPVVSSLSPYDGQSQVPRTGVFVITMDQSVKAVYNGTISLNNPGGTEYIPIQLRSAYETSTGSGVFSSTATMPSGTVTWKVTFSGNTVTIDFGYDMGEFQNFYITVSDKCIQNTSSEKFAGLFDNGPGTLTTGDDLPDWDFTTADVTPPTPVWSAASAVTPYTDPTDEEVNVSTTLTAFSLLFSEPIQWASGYPANLKVGDIALYKSTDVGVYGGDVVFPLCSLVSISGNNLYITWPDDLPSLSKLYVRIKPGIITDLQGLAFAGFNTNGVGAGNGWNFSTKDATLPTVAFSAESECGTSFTATTNFLITLNETGIVLATSRTPISSSNIDSYVTFSGGTFDATVSTSGSNTIISVNPTASLTSGGTYTVGLKAGLWDSGDNAIPAATSSVFTAGDYTAPTTDIFTWKNPDGTSFNINLRVNNEPTGTNTTYYYIVVKAADVVSGTSLNYYQPETVQTLSYSAMGTVVSGVTTATTYHWEGSTSIETDDKDITVYQRGDIIAPANTELLEHVIDLPASDGTDWVVYMFGADGSLCGVNAITGLPSATSNISGILNLRPSTYDILAPTVGFTAKLIDASDEYDGCSELAATDSDSDDDADGIYRNGPIYINFNEAVENANGTAITGATIASSVTLVDNYTTSYSVNTSTSYYDATNKRLVVYPTVPFASGSSVTVTLLANKIQDAIDETRFGPNGTELLSAQTDDFCVETYAGPIVSISPCSGTEVIERSGDIIISVDQDLYAPAEDGGGLLSNVSTDANYVGNYIQVRKHGVYPTDLTGPNTTTLRDGGSIIYHGSTAIDAYFYNAVNITVTYPTSGDGDSTVITISPKDPSSVFWESETWYTVELEQSLHSVDYLDLTDYTTTSVCAIDNYWGYFRAEDSRSPICLFYEDQVNLLVNDGLGTTNTGTTPDVLLDGNTTVETTSNILVSIDEWVQLGFKGFKNLESSDVIEDANALRRYFKLYEVNGSVLTPIEFDAKDFTLDATTDIAQFFIDPYYSAGDDPNFTKGKNYKVCFVNDPDAYEQYLASLTPNSALIDDNLNGVVATCASFTCPADPVATTCLTSATINGYTLYTDGTTKTYLPVTSDSVATLVLCFGVAVDQPTTGSIIIRSGTTTIQSIALSSGVRDADYKCITYTFNLDAGSVINPGWTENTNYIIQFSGDSIISHSGLCYFPSDVEPFDSIHTTDGSAPYITSFIPDLNGNPYSTICLGDKDSTDIFITWNEAVVPQAGKTIEIWRASTNTNIVASQPIYATYDTTASGDAYMRIPNTWFKSKLLYNESYYIHLSEGFVKNLAGIASAQVTTNDSLTFCVGPDPAPEIVCGGYTPANYAYTPDETPTLILTFSEPVQPVSGTGKDVQIYRSGVISNVNDSYLHVAATAFTAVSGSNNTKWKLDTESALAAAGVHDAFVWGDCYDVNVAAGAFKEYSGSQVTAQLVTNTINGYYTQSTCPWTFCIGDNVQPTVTFWPANNQEHVATNSYLYAYISELPVLANGDPLNVTNVESYFTLTKGVAATAVDFDVEFVGNDIVGGDNQKQRIRIVPKDSDGPDWSLSSSNPSLEDDVWYTLTLINPGSNAILLQDENGNDVVSNSTTFHVEDITCPVFDNSPDATVTKSTADSIYATTSLDEAGTIRYVVVGNGVAAPTASAVWGSGFSSLGIARGEASTTAIDPNPNFDINFAFKYDATQATGYDFDVYVYAKDDEVDLFATDAQILAQWPYAMDPEFETEVYRIKDLRTAPNWCDSHSELLNVTFCDNDAPILVKAVPVNLGISNSGRVMSYPVDEPIMLIFNEDVQINDNDETGYKIVLRDASNNIGVPLAYDYSRGDTIILYPLDSASVANEADAFQPYDALNSPVADLDDETDYYLEIDRWAISDDAGCSGVNYFGEWVGKEKLAFRTEDNTGPCLISWTPLTCVESEADLTLTFEEKNQVKVNTALTPADSAYIYIYQVGSIVPHERIPASSITGPVAVTGYTDRWTFTVPTAYMYLSNGNYRVRVPANLFVDNSGNVERCNNGFTWTFDVRDYEAPIASWTTIQDLSYMNIAYTDPSYEGLIASGDAGETVSDVPTRSILKVEFNEDIYIKDATTSGSPWTRIDLMTTNAQKALVAGAITLTETTSAGVNTTLTYDSDGYGNTTNVGNWEFAEIGSDYATIYVYRAEDHWVSLFDGSDPHYGLKSNATYKIALAGSKLADAVDCDNSLNIMGAVSPLVTINTRNDVPPTLTVTDSKDNAVCGTMCVEAASPIKLHFSSKVVKTPWASIDYDSTDPSSWPSESDVNWWTSSNLPLTSADLLSTYNGDFLTFYRTNAAGTAVYDSVQLSSATVDANGMDITLNLASSLVSQGWYKIEFAGGSVKDQIRVPDGNEFVGLSCIFRVKDTQAPYAVSFFPADNATDISNVLGSSTLGSASFGPDSIAVLFSEPIEKSSSSENLVIRRLNGSIFDEVLVSQCNVDPVDKRVLVIPVKDLEEFTSYYVEIPGGYVQDTTACTPNGSLAIDPEVIYSSTNRFAWNFSTADATPPTPITYIPNDTDTVPRNSNLTIIFDENVYADYADCADAGVYIYRQDNFGQSDGWVGDPTTDFGNIVEYIPFWSTSSIPNYTIDGTDVYNGLTRDKIVFNPVNDFSRVGTYYVRVTGSCLRDGQGNYWAGLEDSTTWKFTVTNDVAPVLASTTPAYNHTTAPWQYVELPADDHGYVIADLSMKFVDAINGESLVVAAGSGKFKIMEYRYNPTSFQMEEKLWKEIDVNDPSVVFNNDVVTINDVLLRDNINKVFGSYEECYYVLAESGTVTNGYAGSQTFWAGIDNAFVWRFQTGADDVFVTGYDILSPNLVDDGDEAKNLTIAAASTLKVSFNEGIEALTAPTGKVQVFAVGTSTPAEEVTVTQAMISSKTLTLPLTKLVDETNYYVQVQAGTFGDTSTVSTPNFAFGGVDVWEFQTGDNTAPVAKTLAPTGTCIGSAPTVEMTFTESRGVVKGSGNLEIVDGEGTVVAQVAAADIEISEDGNTVSASVAGLPDTTELTVNVPDGFIFDGDTHSPLPNAAFSWKFTTGENTAPIVVSITPDAPTTADIEIAITFSEVVNPVAGASVMIGDVAVPVENFTTTDNIVYTLAYTVESEKVYSVSVPAGSFQDVNANCTPNKVVASEQTFTVGDLTAPEVVGSTTPSEPSDYKDLVLNLSFTDAVTTATGNVVIYDSEGTVVETIASSAFTAGAGNTVYTYEPTNVRYGDYYVLIDAGAFVDETAAPVGKSCAGISDPTEFTFSVNDNEFVDCYHIIAPLRATTNVPLSTTVVINFCDERIAPGVGSVTIADQSVEQVENVNYFYYPVTTAMIDGNTLSIPVTGLRENTTYSIIIPYGAITDEAGNPFIGITDANLWIFTTGDFTNPTVSVNAVTVYNDGRADNPVVTITSSEAGTVYLAKEGVTASEAALAAAVGTKAAVAILVEAGSVNIDVEGLEAGNYKAYAVDGSGRIGTATNIVVVKAPEVITLYKISAIQGTGETSPLNGQTIRTQGTVTKVTSTGYYMQDANAIYSGIFVASTTAVSAGSSVEIIGTVAEVSGITEMTAITSTEFISPVVTVDAISLASGTAISESYESVLVYVEGKATAAGAQTGDWTAGSYTINNALYGSYTTKLQYTYGIEGIGAGTKVLAVTITNVSELNGKSDLSNAVRVYPNPFDKYITLEVSNDIVITKAVITNIAGQLVKEVENPSNTISTSELRSGVYFISLQTEDGIAKTERIIKK